MTSHGEETAGSAARFGELERLFQRARRLPPEQREAWLDEEIGGDRRLRREVEELLAAHVAAQAPTGTGFLDAPALGQGFKVSSGQEPGGAPARVGPYRVLEVLGRGGMGVVYLAEQDTPRRTVALKVLQPGLMTPDLLRRFELEAEVLGRLHHPGIAQVYEAGVGDATSPPHIAMEYVRGIGLLEHADREGLDRRARLQLFLRVCDAVEHAHQRGVIHRDLKPGNILVEGEGEAARPKVLDFGIARATDADLRTTTLRTDVGQLLGTVQYMSPEQAGGDPNEVDTRSDVYALGVILYELLAGRLPYDVGGRAIHEAVRVIREVDPRPISSVDRNLRGDLTTIVSKALDKDRERRYGSASALAADLRRYLSDQPITAHPPSAIYQLRKFARRNRALVAGAAGVFAALLAGLLATTWQWRQAEKARAGAEHASRAESFQRGIAEARALDAEEARAAEAASRELAERRFTELRSVARAFIFDFDHELKHLPGALGARELIVRTGRQYLDRLARDGVEDPDFKHELAAAYSKLGDVQGLQGEPNLGDMAGALESFDQALRLTREVLEETGDNADAELDLVLLQIRRGDVLRALGRTEEALASYREASVPLDVATWSGWMVERAEDTRRDARMRMGGTLQSLGRLEEAEPLLFEELEIARAMVRRRPDDPLALRPLAVAVSRFGRLLEGRGEAEAAVDQYEEFLQIIGRLVEMEPRNAVFLRDLATAHSLIGGPLARGGRLEEALEHGRESARICELLLEADPDDAQARYDMVGNFSGAGELMLELGRPKEALVSLERARELGRTEVERHADNAILQRRYGVVLYKLGETHRALASDTSAPRKVRIERFREALAWFERSLDHFRAQRARGVFPEPGGPVLDETAAAAQVSLCKMMLGFLGAE